MRFATQSTWPISNAIPARRLARGGRVTTIAPSLGSIRRLTRRARALRRHCTVAVPVGSETVSDSGDSALRRVADRTAAMPYSLASMTGFARTEGTIETLTWAWELRAVNGRGLELRFRLPPGWDALEPGYREMAGKALKRGNVNANLNVRRDTETRASIDEAALANVLTLAMNLHARIPGSPVPRAESLLTMPGVMRQAPADPVQERDTAAGPVQAGFAEALEALVAARAAEGARLATVMSGQLDDIARLRDQAAVEAADQPAAHQMRVMETLRGLLRESPSLPEERIAQEVALLAARSDVREELDRLASHIEAARALMEEGINIGRRFDFLVQEFNREANTLCSKSASVALTNTGLRLKAMIEQLREQVQNIE